MRYSNSEDDVDLKVAESEKSKIALEELVIIEGEELDRESKIKCLESPGRRASTFNA
jgi:hypothetical protein